MLNGSVKPVPASCTQKFASKSLKAALPCPLCIAFVTLRLKDNFEEKSSKMAAGISRLPPLTLRGAFSSINGMEFNDAKKKNGRALINDNLFNIEVEEVQNRERRTAVIRARIFRTTNVTQPPYIIEFEVDMETRKVVQSRCSCVAGDAANCKHGAALYIYVNEERSKGKTDSKQVWTAPSSLP